MIGSLRGTVIDRQGALDKEVAEVLVEVMGVGYRVVVTAATLGRLPSGNPNSGSGEILLHIHHHHWEADQKLFGFATRDERDAFEGLLSAHKVGPALALAIIGTYPPVELARVLANDDIDALCQVPGVGKKTAQRLLVDLKSTLVLPVLDTDTGASIDLTGATTAENQALADVREALANLGYGTEDIKVAMKTLSGAESVEELTVDGSIDSGALLKRALRSMAGA